MTRFFAAVGCALAVVCLGFYLLTGFSLVDVFGDGLRWVAAAYLTWSMVYTAERFE